MNKSKIIERIERQLGGIDLVSLLVDRLPPTDLQSVLIEVYRQISARRKPADVLSEYGANSLVRPSGVSPLTLLEWEQAAFASLPPEFHPLALAPVCPLGTSAAVALVDQNRVLSTTRNTEVVSDSTNVLTLECAVRRRELLHADPKSATPVHLAASHRLLRTQRYHDSKSVSHFAAFALCSAGRDQGNLRFELSALVRHIGVYVRALRAFVHPQLPLRLAVTDFAASDRQSLIAEQLFAPVQQSFTDIECVIDHERTSGRGYYADLCFHIHAPAPDGSLLELVDGGLVDWTRKYLSNGKERCVISGIGSERVCVVFGGTSRQ